METYDPIGSTLVAVRRTIRLGADVRAATLRAWIKGPTCAESSAGIISSVPPRTELRAFSLSNGTAVIDMNRRFQRSGLGTVYEGQLLEQLTWTVTQFPAVERALLKVDGEFKEDYMGHGCIIDEKHPLRRN